MSSPRILVADDQPDVLQALRLLLKSEGYSAEMVASPGAVLQAIEVGDFDAVLMDLNYTRDTTGGDEAGAAPHGAGGSFGRPRPDPGRTRYRQGSGGGVAARGQRACRQAVRGGQPGWV